jgi:hypothetical protein
MPGGRVHWPGGGGVNRRLLPPTAPRRLAPVARPITYAMAHNVYYVKKLFLCYQ